VRALQVLSRIGPEAAPAVPGIAELLKSGDAATKTEALFALGAIGPTAQAAVTIIADQLGDADPRVVQAAVYALGKIGPASNTALPLLSKLTQSQDELLRMTSVWAILKISPGTPQLIQQALPVLVQGLKHSREFVRIEAAMALGELGPAASSAVPDLQGAASDTSAAVRSAVSAAIKKIKG
jgi:HEAT repeat protein